MTLEMVTCEVGKVGNSHQCRALLAIMNGSDLILKTVGSQHRFPSERQYSPVYVLISHSGYCKHSHFGKQLSRTQGSNLNVEKLYPINSKLSLS